MLRDLGFKSLRDEYWLRVKGSGAKGLRVQDQCSHNRPYII